MKTKMSATFPDRIGLRAGESGAAVITLQKFLHRFGYLRVATFEPKLAGIPALRGSPEPQVGVFDEVTAEALRQYQRFHGLPVSGELDMATATQMSLPRCGVADFGIGLTYVPHGNRWPTTNLNYGFVEYCQDISAQATREAITAALALWSQVGPLRFCEVPIGSNPDIRIRFVSGDHGDGYPFDGPGNTLAHAFYPPPNGGDIAGDAHFDEAEGWSTALPVPAGAFDLVSVAAHELGHSLGLMHSSDRAALMFPTYLGPHRYLAQDDIDGIRSIYGSGQPYQPYGPYGFCQNFSIGLDLISQKETK